MESLLRCIFMQNMGCDNVIIVSNPAADATRHQINLKKTDKTFFGLFFFFKPRSVALFKHHFSTEIFVVVAGIEPGARKVSPTVLTSLI